RGTAAAAHQVACGALMSGQRQLAVDESDDGVRQQVRFGQLPARRQAHSGTGSARTALTRLLAGIAHAVDLTVLCSARRRSSAARSCWRPRWILLLTVPSFTPSVAPISS